MLYILMFYRVKKRAVDIPFYCRVVNRRPKNLLSFHMVYSNTIGNYASNIKLRILASINVPSFDT